MHYKLLSENTGDCDLSPEDRLLQNWTLFCSNKLKVPGLDDAPEKLKQLLEIEGLSKLKIKGSLLPYLVNPNTQAVPHDVDVKIVVKTEKQAVDILSKIKRLPLTLKIQHIHRIKGHFHSCIIRLGSVEVELICEPKAPKVDPKSPPCDYYHSSLQLVIERKRTATTLTSSDFPEHKNTLSSMTGNLPKALACIQSSIAEPCREAIDLHRVVKAEAGGLHPSSTQHHKNAYDTFKDKLLAPLAKGKKRADEKFIYKLFNDYGKDTISEKASDSHIIFGLTQLFFAMLLAKESDNDYALSARLADINASLKDPAVDQEAPLSAANYAQVKAFTTHLNSLFSEPDPENEKLNTMLQNFRLSRDLQGLYHAYKLQELGIKSEIDTMTLPFLVDQAQQEQLSQNFLRAQAIMGDYPLTHPPISTILTFLSKKSDCEFIPKLHANIMLDTATQAVAFEQFTDALSKSTPATCTEMLTTHLRHLFRIASQESPPEGSPAPAITIGLKRLFSMLLAAKELTPNFDLKTSLDHVVTILSDETLHESLRKQASIFWDSLQPILIEPDPENKRQTTLTKGAAVSRQLLALYHAHKFEEKGLASLVAEKSEPFLCDIKTQGRLLETLSDAQYLLGKCSLTHPPTSEIMDYLSTHSKLDFFQTLALDKETHEIEFNRFSGQLSRSTPTAREGMIEQFIHQLFTSSGQVAPSEVESAPDFTMGLKRLFSMLLAAKDLASTFPLKASFDCVNTFLKDERLDPDLRGQASAFWSTLAPIFTEPDPEDKKLKSLIQGFSLSRQIVALYHSHQLKNSQKSKRAEPFAEGNGKTKKNLANLVFEAQKYVRDEHHDPSLTEMTKFIHEKTGLSFFSTLLGKLDPSQKIAPAATPSSPKVKSKTADSTLERVKILPNVFEKCVAAFEKSPKIKEKSSLTVQKILNFINSTPDLISLETLLHFKQTLSDSKDQLQEIYAHAHSQKQSSNSKKGKKKKGPTSEEQTLSQFKSIFKGKEIERLITKLDAFIIARLNPEQLGKSDLFLESSDHSKFMANYKTLSNFGASMALCEKYNFPVPCTLGVREAKESLSRYHDKIQKSLPLLLATEAISDDNTQGDGLNREEIISDMLAHNHHCLWSFNMEKLSSELSPKSVLTPTLKVIMAVRNCRDMPTAENSAHLNTCLSELVPSAQQSAQKCHAALYGWAICHLPIEISREHALLKKCSKSEPSQQPLKDHMPKIYEAVIYSDRSPFQADPPPYFFSLNADMLANLKSAPSIPDESIYALRTMMTPEACIEFQRDQHCKDGDSAFKAMLRTSEAYQKGLLLKEGRQLKMNWAALPELAQPYCDHFLSTAMMALASVEQDLVQASRLHAIITKYSEPGLSKIQQEARALLPILDLCLNNGTQDYQEFINNTHEKTLAFDAEIKKIPGSPSYSPMFLIKVMVLPLQICFSHWRKSICDNEPDLSKTQVTSFKILNSLAKKYQPPTELSLSKGASSMFKCLEIFNRVFNEGLPLFSNSSEFNMLLDSLHNSKTNSNSLIMDKIFLVHFLKNAKDASLQQMGLDFTKISADNQRYFINLIAQAKPCLDLKRPRMGSEYVIWKMRYLDLLDSVSCAVSETDRQKAAPSFLNTLQGFHRHLGAAKQMVEGVSKAVAAQLGKTVKDVADPIDLGGPADTAGRPGTIVPEGDTTQKSISDTLSSIWMDLSDVFTDPETLQKKLTRIQLALDCFISQECPEQRSLIAEKFIGLFLRQIYIGKEDEATLDAFTKFASHFSLKLPITSEATPGELRPSDPAPTNLDKIILSLKQLSFTYPRVDQEKQSTIQVELKKILAIELPDELQRCQPGPTAMIDHEKFLALDFQLCQLTKCFPKDDVERVTTPLRCKAGELVKDPSPSHQRYLQQLSARGLAQLSTKEVAELSEKYPAVLSLMFDIEYSSQGLPIPAVDNAQKIELSRLKASLREMSLSKFTFYYTLLLSESKSELETESSETTISRQDQLDCYQHLIQSSYPHLVATTACKDNINRIQSLTTLLTQNSPSLWLDTDTVLSNLTISTEADSFLYESYMMISKVNADRSAWAEDIQALSSDLAMARGISFVVPSQNEQALQTAVLDWAIFHLPQKSCIAVNLQDSLPVGYHRPIITLPAPSDDTLKPILSLTPAQVEALSQEENFHPDNPILKTLMDPEACAIIDETADPAYLKAYVIFNDLLENASSKAKEADFPDLKQPYVDNFIRWALIKFQNEDLLGFPAPSQEKSKRLLQWNKALRPTLHRYASSRKSRVQVEAARLLETFTLATTESDTQLLRINLERELGKLQDWVKADSLNNSFTFHHFTRRVFDLILLKFLPELSNTKPKQQCLFLSDKKTNEEQAIFDKIIVLLLQEKHTKHITDYKISVLELFQMQHTTYLAKMEGIQIFDSIEEINAELNALDQLDKSVYGKLLSELIEEKVLVHCFRNLDTLREVGRLSKKNQRILYKLLLNAKPKFDSSTTPIASPYLNWKMSMDTFIKHQTILDKTEIEDTQKQGDYLTKFLNEHPHAHSYKVVIAPIVKKMVKSAENKESLELILNYLWLDICTLCNRETNHGLQIDYIDWCLSNFIKLFGEIIDPTKLRVYLNRIQNVLHLEGCSELEVETINDFVTKYGGDAILYKDLMQGTVPDIGKYLKNVNARNFDALKHTHKLLREVNNWEFDKLAEKVELEFIITNMMDTLVMFFKELSEETTLKCQKDPEFAWQLDFEFSELARKVDRNTALILVLCRAALWRYMPEDIQETHQDYISSITEELASDRYKHGKYTLSNNVTRLYKMMTTDNQKK